MAQLAHATLGASSSERWLHCPGSVQASDGMPNESSVDSRTGNCAHDVAELCQREKRPAIDYLGATIAKYEDIEVDEDMCEAVQVYLDFIDEEIAKYHAEGHTDEISLVEHRFDLRSLHPDMFGTCDRVIYFPAWRRLLVIDYKNGWKSVAVEGNTQILYYALGALWTKDNWDIETVDLVIVQPKTTHNRGIKRWSCQRGYLLQFKDRLLEGAERTKDKRPTFLPGKWCFFCPAASICPHLEKLCEEISMARFNPDGTLTPMPADKMPLDKLKIAWENAGIVEGWAKSVKAFAHNQALAGRKLPGTKLVEGRAGRRKWIDVGRAVKVIRNLLDMGALEVKDDTALFTTSELRSPSQIETLIGKKNADAIKGLWEKGNVGVSLVADTDERPEVQRLTGEEEFD